MDIKLGADPEFFLTGRYNKRVSAHNLVKGTKHDPFKLNKGALQADGTAVEFNIDPASNPDEFAQNITTVLGQVREIVPKEYAFNFSPAITYNTGYFQEEIPESAKELGCDPDFDAWRGGAVNPRPQPNLGFRTASGHLHVGWTDDADIKDPDHLEDCMAVVRRLDYYFSTTSALWETQRDVDRRRLYGEFGAFRPKKYGVEYRVLGNSWLKYPKMWPWLFQFVNHAVNTLEQGISDDALYVKPVLDTATGCLDRRKSLPHPYFHSMTDIYGPATRPSIYQEAIEYSWRMLPKGAPKFDPKFLLE